MLKFLKKNHLLNRTIVSKDSTRFVNELKKRYGCKILEYKSGLEFSTWVIPVEWNLKKATLSNADGIIISDKDSLLFVAPYSKSFSGSISKEELELHTLVNPSRPDCFSYEFRIAYDYKRRLKEWRITLPKLKLDSLPRGNYEIDIEVETKPGSLKIAEFKINGAQKEVFAFLSHYCHPSQINDGIGGTIIMFEIMKRIQKLFPKTKFSYLSLAMPETIGSSVYLSEKQNKIPDFIGSAFCEMGGSTSPFQMVFSRRGNTYIDRVFEYLIDKYHSGNNRKVKFRKGWGNDELVFDSPGVDIPSVSIDRYPFKNYHTNLDNLDSFDEQKAEEMIDFFLKAVQILEEDFIPKPVHKVPFYLTRFELYADWTYDRNNYDKNTILLDSMWEDLTVFDISIKYNLEYEYVKQFFNKLSNLGLIKEKQINSSYSKKPII